MTDYALQTLSAGSGDIAAVSDENKTGIVQTGSTENASLERAEQLSKDAYLTMYVKDAMSNGVVCTDPQTSIRDAAKLMKQHGVSSLLIKGEKKIVGIITDRDFRIRVLAEGVSDTEMIKSIMTPSPMCIDVSCRLHDALADAQATAELFLAQASYLGACPRIENLL